MKKILYIVFTILQIIFAYGIHLLNYFTKKKLGMNRWVVYHNMQISKIFVVDVLKYVVLAITIFTTIKLVKVNAARMKHSNLLKLDAAILLIINAILTIIIVFFNNVSQKLNYYYIIILLLIYILQVVKILLIGDANESGTKNKNN